MASIRETIKGSVTASHGREMAYVSHRNWKFAHINHNDREWTVRHDGERIIEIYRLVNIREVMQPHTRKIRPRGDARYEIEKKFALTERDGESR
jgi:hypothetical protein